MENQRVTALNAQGNQEKKTLEPELKTLEANRKYYFTEKLSQLI